MAGDPRDSAADTTVCAPDAVLFASYGTTREEQRAASLDTVAEALAEAFPGAQLAQAYTSPKVRRVLERRGEPVPSVADALQQLIASGARNILVQSGHVVAGAAYEQVLQGVNTVRTKLAAAERGVEQSMAQTKYAKSPIQSINKHPKTVQSAYSVGAPLDEPPVSVQIVIGDPLLATAQDVIALADILDEVFPARPDTAVVLMGHGADCTAGLPYGALGYRLHELGRDDLIVGAMHGHPDFGSVCVLLARHGLAAREFRVARRVVLAPLMLTAGAHAQQDMAGNAPASWKSRLESAGYRVEPHLQGLGALPTVRALYVEHARMAWRAR